MKGDIEKVVVTEEEINKKAKEISQTLAEEYMDKDLTLIGILNAALCFYRTLYGFSRFPCGPLPHRLPNLQIL